MARNVVNSGKRANVVNATVINATVANPVDEDAAARTAEEVNNEVNDAAETNEATASADIADYGRTFSNCIAYLKAIGGKVIKNIKVKNTNFTEKDNYTMVSFTLGENVQGYVAREDGSFIQGERNVIFTSLFAIVGAVKENDELSWVANYLIEHPKSLNLLFNGGTIDIIQVPVTAGEIYVNPFSSKREEVVFEHDTIINNVIGFHLGKTGEKVAERLMDKLLDEI